MPIELSRRASTSRFEILCVSVDEWREKGPFRVRVIQMPSTEAKSFRESAAPESMQEIIWDARPRRSRVSWTLLASLLVVVTFTISCVAWRVEDATLWYATGVVFVVALGLATILPRVDGLIDVRSQAPPRRLLIDSRELAFEGPSGRRTFPRGRIRVERRDVDGRHRAVLTSDADEVVLFDSQHELEVDWLVTRLDEALAD